MKKPNSVELILKKYGWRIIAGRVEYKGFENLLNPDMPDWKMEAAPEPEVEPQVDVELVSQKRAADRANHEQLIAAQKRVDSLKLKAKEKTSEKN